VKVFLTKPIGQSELLDAILLALGLRAVEDHSMERPSLAKDRPGGRSLNILLAEDNLVNQKPRDQVARKRGAHHVVLAANGKEVLEALEKVRPFIFDIVLMDIQNA